jgi:hypothetical protein
MLASGDLLLRHLMLLIGKNGIAGQKVQSIGFCSAVCSKGMTGLELAKKVHTKIQFEGYRL